MIQFKEEGNYQEGALVLVDKPLHWTSFDVVNKLRWCLRGTCGKLKVGHAGTLDPLATGLVIICMGRWTKEIEKYMGQQKEYVAQLTFGATTASYDLETPVEGDYPWQHITREFFDAVLQKFIGEIDQIPPVFSAVRVDGVRAYEKARKGKGPEMQARKVYIKEIEVLRFELPVVELRVVCSKGTYIRSLAHDLGKACGSGAYLSALRRTAIGDFRVENANNMEDLVAFLQKGLKLRNFFVLKGVFVKDINMKLSKFKFKLPQELVALHPTPNRDECRLMVLNRKTGDIEHKVFKDIIDYFDEEDVFVFNDTKVFPARLYGNKEKTGAEIEVFLLRELNKDLRIWDVLVDPARKIRIGNKLYFGEDDSLVAEVIDNTTSRGRTLRFLYDGDYEKFKKILYGLGETPLPKLIERKVEPEDAERYQTIYAKNEGAVAAPTAGLHFSRELMKRLEIKGVNFAFLTLHVGLGNFREVDVEDLTKHKMDSEQIFVGSEVVKVVNEAKDEKRKVCAVGTTVVRTLESCVTTKGRLTEYEGWTNKFIFPPYDFSVPDAFVSNFHLPYSTLLMMVAAFGGYDKVMKAYEVAVKEKYRFGTYGDAMLII